MTEPHLCVLLHSDLLAQLHLCVYLHAHTRYRVVGIPRSRAELEVVLPKLQVDLIVCGGAFRLPVAKPLRAELQRCGQRLLVLRHHDRPASLDWLRRSIERGDSGPRAP